MNNLKALYNKVLTFLKEAKGKLKLENSENNLVVEKIKLYLNKIYSFLLVVFNKVAKYVNETLMLDIEEGRNKRIAVLVATIFMAILLCIELFVPRENAIAVYLDDEYIGTANISVSMDSFEDDLQQKAYDEYGDIIEITTGDVTIEKVNEDVENLISYDSLINKSYDKIQENIVFLGFSIYVEGNEEIMVETEAEAEAILESILGEYRTENTVEIGFMENVEIKSSIGGIDTYSTKEEAYDYLTHSVVKTKEHIIKEGDTLWDISWLNDITVNELLEMNPDFTEETVLQIGMVLQLVLPKPFLTTYTVDEITYDDVAYRPVEVIENNNEYKTYSKTVQEGSDGEKTVKDSITYVNGIETDRVNLEEVIHIEPVTKIVEVGTLNAPPKRAVGTFINPARGRITDVFASRGGKHAGIDIAAPVGTPIYASDGGKVIRANWYGGYGNIVIIDHQNGYQTYYAHNSALHVSAGEMVAQGQLIASMGSTGNSTGSHIHFEVRLNGIPKNPFNYLQ